MRVAEVPRLSTADGDSVILRPDSLPKLQAALEAATARDGLGTAYESDSVQAVVRWDFRRCPSCGEAQMKRNVQVRFSDDVRLGEDDTSDVWPCMDCAAQLLHGIDSYMDGREGDLLGDAL